MKEKQIDKLYIDRFIDSMENDYENWKMNHYAGPGMSWAEFHSPTYEKENGGRLSFGWSSNHIGAWVNGYFSWKIPFAVLNPFNPIFWKFRRAEKRMKNYLRSKEKELYLDNLKNVL